MKIAKNAHSVTMAEPSKTDGCKNENPFIIMLRTAIDEKVNGMQYDVYWRNQGIDWIGQNIPKRKIVLSINCVVDKMIIFILIDKT